MRRELGGLYKASILPSVKLTSLARGGEPEEACRYSSESWEDVLLNKKRKTRQSTPIWEEFA